MMGSPDTQTVSLAMATVRALTAFRWPELFSVLAAVLSAIATLLLVLLTRRMNLWTQSLRAPTPTVLSGTIEPKQHGPSAIRLELANPGEAPIWISGATPVGMPEIARGYPIFPVTVRSIETGDVIKTNALAPGATAALEFGAEITPAAAASWQGTLPRFIRVILHVTTGGKRRGARYVLWAWPGFEPRVTLTLAANVSWRAARSPELAKALLARGAAKRCGRMRRRR
jgi:hypothetical protein